MRVVVKQFLVFLFICCLVGDTFAQCASGGTPFGFEDTEQRVQLEDDMYNFFFTIIDGLSLGAAVLGPVSFGVGAILTACLEFVFPEPSVEVGNLTGRLACLMQSAIAYAEYQTILLGVGTNLNRAGEKVQKYLSMKNGTTPFLSHLQLAQAECALALSSLLDSNFSSQPANFGSSLPYVIPLSLLHLAILREFYIHAYPLGRNGAGLGSVGGQIALINQANATLQSYKDFFEMAWSNFQTWNAGNIQTNDDSTIEVHYVSAYDSNTRANLGNLKPCGVYFDQPAGYYQNGSGLVLQDAASTPVYALLMSYVPYLYLLLPWNVRPFEVIPAIPKYLNMSIQLGPYAAAQGAVYFSNPTTNSTPSYFWGSARYTGIDVSDTSNLNYQSDDTTLFSRGYLMSGMIYTQNNFVSCTNTSSKLCNLPFINVRSTYSLKSGAPGTASGESALGVDYSSWTKYSCDGDTFSGSANAPSNYFVMGLGISALPNAGISGFVLSYMDPSRQKFAVQNVNYGANVPTFQTTCVENSCNQYGAYRDSNNTLYSNVGSLNISMGSNYFVTCMSQAYGGAAITNSHTYPIALQGLGVTFTHHSLVFPKLPNANFVSNSSSLLPYNWTVGAWNNTFSRLFLETDMSLNYVWQAVFQPGLRTILSQQLPFLQSIVNVTSAEEMLSYSQQNLVNNSLQTYLQAIGAQFAAYVSNPLPEIFLLSPNCSSTINAPFAGFLKLGIENCQNLVNTFGHDPGLLPLMVPVAVAHLGLLREQYLNGSAAYGTWTKCCSGTKSDACTMPDLAETYFGLSPASQDPAWERELVGTYTFYVSFFNLMVPKWKEWRNSLFIPSEFEKSWRVTDLLSKITLQGGPLEPGDCMPCFATGTVKAMQNEAFAYLMDALAPIDLLHLMVPGLGVANKTAVPQFARNAVELGPYAPAYYNNSTLLAGFSNETFFWSEVGNITSFVSCSGEIISSLNLTFADGRVDHGLNASCFGNWNETVVPPSVVRSFVGQYGFQQEYLGQYWALFNFAVGFVNNSVAPLIGTLTTGPYFNATAGQTYALAGTGQGFVPQATPQYMNNTLVIGSMGFRFVKAALLEGRNENLSPESLPSLSVCGRFGSQCSIATPCCAPWSCLRHSGRGGCGNQSVIAESFKCAARGQAVSFDESLSAPVAFNIVWSGCSVNVTVVNNDQSLAVGSAGLFVQLQQNLSGVLVSSSSGCIGQPLSGNLSCFLDTIQAGHNISRAFFVNSTVSNAATLIVTYLYFGAEDFQVQSITQVTQGTLCWAPTITTTATTTTTTTVPTTTTKVTLPTTTLATTTATATTVAPTQPSASFVLQILAQTPNLDCDSQIEASLLIENLGPESIPLGSYLITISLSAGAGSNLTVPSTCTKPLGQPNTAYCSIGELSKGKSSLPFAFQVASGSPTFSVSALLTVLQSAQNTTFSTTTGNLTCVVAPTTAMTTTTTLASATSFASTTTTATMSATSTVGLTSAGAIVCTQNFNNCGDLSMYACVAVAGLKDLECALKPVCSGNIDNSNASGNCPPGSFCTLLADGFTFGCVLSSS